MGPGSGLPWRRREKLYGRKSTPSGPETLYWLNYRVFKSLHFFLSKLFMSVSSSESFFFRNCYTKVLINSWSGGGSNTRFKHGHVWHQYALWSFFVREPKQCAIVSFLQVERLFCVTLPYQTFLQPIWKSVSSKKEAPPSPHVFTISCVQELCTWPEYWRRDWMLSSHGMKKVSFPLMTTPQTTDCLTCCTTARLILQVYILRNMSFHISPLI